MENEDDEENLLHFLFLFKKHEVFQ